MKGGGYYKTLMKQGVISNQINIHWEKICLEDNGIFSFLKKGYFKRHVRNSKIRKTYQNSGIEVLKGKYQRKKANQLNPSPLNHTHLQALEIKNTGIPLKDGQPYPKRMTNNTLSPAKK